jgi:flagellar hook assembly protein FlgD
VRTLVGEVRAGGLHIADWDGKNAQGAAVPSGTYFYRLEVGGWQETRSLTLVK